MTAEQLQAARAAHWRQNQNPILTLDDAESWLQQHPLCLYLPRQAQLPAPAPSFVEACLGRAAATPAAAAIEQAQEMLTRLIASGSVVALNLFGRVSEQPDFLAHTQALPYVLCLRADANWKHAPEKSSGHKVSPLVLELWKALDKEGVLTADAARETLGRELTEAAVLRALCELWQGLRISPVLAEPGQPARWELFRVHHRDALTTAGATGQVTALSLLVSMYLQSVYAASGEEIEIFLSPLASRSRVREAVRGLSATRQIHSLSLDAQTYYFLEGGLPEFAEVVASAPVTAEPRRAEKKPQATSPVRPASPSSRPAAAAPLFAGRRPVPPAAKSDWKGPQRPAAHETQAGKPPASRPARPPLTGPRPDTRNGPRPAARPGAWTGAQKRDQPKPWVRPGQAPRSAPTPARRSESSFPSRPAGGDSRDPRGDRGSVDRSKAGSFRASGRPPGRSTGGPPGRSTGRPLGRSTGGPPGRSTGRPPGRTPGRPTGLAPAAAANRPPATGRPIDRPSQSFREKNGRSGPPRANRASVDPRRPSPAAGRPSGSLPARPSRPPTSFRTRGDRGGPPPARKYDRPRPAGDQKPGAKPVWSRGTNPPKPKPGGSKSFRPAGKAGKTSARPGQPPTSFRGPKPFRKKPER